MATVTKRNGSTESVSFDKILARINKLSYGLDVSANGVNVLYLCQRTIKGIIEGIHTYQLDELAAKECAYLIPRHPDYGTLAARISISNLHKQTEKSFSKVVQLLREKGTFMSDAFCDTVKEFATELDSAIVHDRDFNLSYIGFLTLGKGYLIRLNGVIVERFQHLLMRVAVQLHGHRKDLSSILKSYDQMSRGFYTHATPTLYNSGMNIAQLSSCFLMQMDDDLADIFSAISKCAMISKTAGGIGINIHSVRAAGSYIKGINGYANGVVPMLRVLNHVSRYVDQGSKRPGSFAVYVEPWHADIFDILVLRRPQTKEDLAARNLFYAMWIPDLFMKRVKADDKWSLIDPAVCPSLSLVWGKEFEDLYESLEKDGKFVRQVSARDLFSEMFSCCHETGMPYILFKDAINAKSNQQHLGTIRCANLCVEICEYTAKDEIAVCTLASIVLQQFVKPNREYDFQALHEVAKQVTRNLDRTIEVNYYPTEETKTSNMRHRPLGIGIQGLADTFLMMQVDWGTEEAMRLDSHIHETIYHGALEASCELAQEEGQHPSFPGSPFSKGWFQFNLWQGKELNDPVDTCGLWDWDKLRKDVMKFGTRNSLLTALMPTASTSTIMKSNECFEPFVRNLIVRKTSSGDHTLINEYLVRDLIKAGLWSEEMSRKLQATRGSVQNLDIPLALKTRYRTAFEIPQKKLAMHVLKRSPFIDQCQSYNCFVENSTYEAFSSRLFFLWENGSKVGHYYMRTPPGANAIAVTQIAASSAKDAQQITEDKANEILQCSIDNADACVMCTS